MDTSAEDSCPPDAASGHSTAEYGGTTPASPKIGKVAPIINKEDLSFRRPARDVPFYKEQDAGERDGPPC